MAGDDDKPEGGRRRELRARSSRRGAAIAPSTCGCTSSFTRCTTRSRANRCPTISLNLIDKDAAHGNEEAAIRPTSRAKK